MRRLVPQVDFSKGSSDKRIFNAQVFNMNDKDELDLYVAVMRTYAEHLTSEPKHFFNSKDSTVRVVIEWMGAKTFEEEFLEAPLPEEDDASPVKKKTSLELLGEQLLGVNMGGAKPSA